MLDKPDEMLELHGLGTLAALELVLPEDHAVLGGLALKKENYSTEAETFVLGFYLKPRFNLLESRKGYDYVFKYAGKFVCLAKQTNYVLKSF